MTSPYDPILDPTPHPNETATRLGQPLAILDYQITRRRKIHVLHFPNERHHMVFNTVPELCQEAIRRRFHHLVITPDPYTHEPVGLRITLHDYTQLPLDEPQPPDIT